MKSYLLVLLLNMAIEVPLVMLFLRHRGWKRVVPVAVLANLLTHPALHFVLPLLISTSELGRFILVGELGVFVFESAVYLLLVRPRPWPLAVAAAAAANAASYAVGLVIF